MGGQIQLYSINNYFTGNVLLYNSLMKAQNRDNRRKQQRRDKGKLEWLDFTFSFKIHNEVLQEKTTEPQTALLKAIFKEGHNLKSCYKNNYLSVEPNVHLFQFHRCGSVCM